MKNRKENQKFLKEQIITYLGNKRALLGFLEKGFKAAKDELKKEKFSFCDVFSGSGIVARFAKKHSNFIVANDLEEYSKIINLCYLSNENTDTIKELQNFHQKLTSNIQLQKGFITELYAPKDENHIQKGERVFYTPKNAMYLDTMRQKIQNEIPSNLRHFFIAPLIYEASVHSNTAGIFKGFYKGKNGIGKFGGEGENALKRIKGEIVLQMPLFSNFQCPFEVIQQEANILAKELENIDVAYLDPPYNQHPYSSNYFMLNLIANYKRPLQISKVSGIPNNWNRSDFNKANCAEESLFNLIANLKAKIILLSYNCEGFIQKEHFKKRLCTLGRCEILEEKYNTFRASRNLKSRPLYIHEQLYILIKN
ncbi:MULTISPECIES: DNA adenine methylase [unclassified Campylobacter]|uniref:DNA adenine methylase n=1 Tax=unclassified Campylobacter TaxID=2593542 RepID=UPI002B061B72